MSFLGIDLGTSGLCKTRSNTGPQKRRMTRLSRSKNPPVCVLRLFGGREMYSVDIYSRVRRACLKDGMSSREAARYFAALAEWRGLCAS